MGKQIKALLFLRIEPMKRVFEMDEILASIPQVQRIYEVTGEFELFVEVIVEGSTELGMIVNKISRIPGVKLIQIFVVTKVIKENTEYRCK
ncbi:Lrp/AsnC family transcriptional regulator [Pyrococcus sp. NA2]|uniref:Lrp/AsnC family transcriptional regulator n=1 Tax=Pyrococcus sp. (strain NA2) TaxID=342949 RepID=UPI000B2AC05F|nr:Lrp/AsnC family transcriptional regulator [Pyrococcus sp. NA2]